MTPDPRKAPEPQPRFEHGPPAFTPPPLPVAQGAGRSGGGEPPSPPPRERLGPPARRAWLAALLAGGVAFAVYAWGAAPTVLSGDSAELAATAFVGGVPHPTGYPSFVLLGRLAGALLPGDPSHRIALLCAASGALGVAFLTLLLAELGLGFGAALAGGIFYAGTFTLWWSSIRVEVYAPAIALAVFALWRVQVARRTLRARSGLVAAFAIGLAMTGHWSFAPALAIAGLALAARARRAGALTPALVAGAALALALGLSPYLYLVWADGHTTLTNFLHYSIEPAGGQYGLTPATFDSVSERLRFLFLGAETHPRQLYRHLPTALANLGMAWARFAAFEVGPLALLLALGGEGALAARDRGAARLLAGIALVTPALGALVVDGPLLQVFMMATTVAVAALAACGLDGLFARSGARAPVAVALAVALVLVPHELRVRADHRPLGVPWMRWETEGPPHIRTFVPQLRHQRAERARAERLLAAIPESSFVAAHWEVVMTLKYLQSAEGRRPDLTLDPWYEPAHMVRIERWQRAHALATHPVVMVGVIPGLADRLASPELLPAQTDVPVFVERHAVRAR